MGNPNARPKAGSGRRSNSQQSNHTYNSAVSPKTPTKRRTLNSGSMETGSNMGSNGSMRNDSVESGLANLSIQGESPTKASLKFKSYKTGTLITNNGVPADAFIAALPPLKHSPLPSPKVSQLSATTPAFVPRTPQPVAPLKNVLPTPNTGTPEFQRVQNLLDDLRSPTNAAGLRNGQYYNPFYTPPATGPSSLMPTPEYHPPGPVRPPRVYYQRTHKSKKDILIGANGVVRNAVKVIESFLPNGSPYHEYIPEFDGPDYDFVAEFHKMSAKEKLDLLANKQVEILVTLATYDGEEKAEIIIVKKKGKKRNFKGKAAATPLDGAVEAEQGGLAADSGVSLAGLNATDGGSTADVKRKGKENVDNMGAVVSEGIKGATTVIDTINALGPDFAINVKSLHVTLDFTSIPVAGSSEVAPIPTGPRGSPGPMLPSGPLSFGTNFDFITSLVRTLQSFTALKHVVINLRVLSSHNSRPISIPQLTLVLPFYDLGFTDWKISYQTEFFTTVVPIRDHDYPLKWLDRERNKILRERERKLENAVFVRHSGFQGSVATWNKPK